MSTPILQELATTFPVPSREEFAALFDGADPNAFAEVGRRFASDKILTDLSRLYGIAATFWVTATADQKDSLVGFSDGILAIAVHLASKLEDDLAQFRGNHQKDHIHREVNAAELGSVWTIARQKRDLAYRALKPVAGLDPGRKAELSGALGTADDADSLARGTELLATLADKWIADPELATVVKLTRIDGEWAKRLRASAATLRRSADLARSRMTVQVSQGDLDVLDGRNLHVLKLVVDLFDEAHDIDPTIPRLIPIAVARYFNNRRKVNADPADAQDEDPVGD